MEFSTFIFMSSIACLLVATVLLVKPWWVAAVPAYLGMLALWFTPYMGATPVREVVSWGVAVIIVVGIRHLQPSGEPDGRNTGNVYVGLASLAGGLLGMVISLNFILLGTIIGSAMGLLAYSRTPHGKWIKFPSSTFIQYFCAKCLPAIVAAAIIVSCIEGLQFYFMTTR